MTEKRIFHFVHDEARRRAAEFCREAPDGWVAVISEPTRTLAQNATFHQIYTALEKSRHPYAGSSRSKEQWKMILVSGHTKATTGDDPEIVLGLEGELINLRESTAKMSVKRGASLIEYCLAYCVMHGIRISDGED